MRGLTWLNPKPEPPSTCCSACLMMSSVMPSTLMSIWKAVMASRSPATLKSMSPVHWGGGLT